MPLVRKVEDGVAYAALGVAVVQSVQIYLNAAPPLKDLRLAPPEDQQSKQLLLDADFFGLIVVLAVGGGGALLVRKWYPLLLSSAALLAISAYHRRVLRSPTT